VQKRIRFIVERMEASIANHEFEKARFYSDEERKERDHLKQLREKYRLDDHPALNIRREDIERAVGKLVGVPIEAIRRSPNGGSRRFRFDVRLERFDWASRDGTSLMVGEKSSFHQ